MKQNLKTV